MADWLAGCLGWLAVGHANWVDFGDLGGSWRASWLLASSGLASLASLAREPRPGLARLARLAGQGDPRIQGTGPRSGKMMIRGVYNTPINHLPTYQNDKE